MRQRMRLQRLRRLRLRRLRLLLVVGILPRLLDHQLFSINLTGRRSLVARFDEFVSAAFYCFRPARALSS
jgi:hypothetical protein